MRDLFIRTRDLRSNEEKAFDARCELEVWHAKNIRHRVYRSLRLSQDCPDDIFCTIYDDVDGTFVATPIWYDTLEGDDRPLVLYEVNPELIDAQFALTYLINLGIVHTEDGKIKEFDDPRQVIYDQIKQFKEGDFFQVEDSEGNFRLYTLLRFITILDDPSYREYVNNPQGRSEE